MEVDCTSPSMVKTVTRPTWTRTQGTRTSALLSERHQTLTSVTDSSIDSDSRRRPAATRSKSVGRIERLDHHSGEDQNSRAGKCPGKFERSFVRGWLACPSANCPRYHDRNIQMNGSIKLLSPPSFQKTLSTSLAVLFRSYRDATASRPPDRHDRRTRELWLEVSTMQRSFGQKFGQNCKSFLKRFPLPRTETCRKSSCGTKTASRPLVASNRV